ncbi:MAG: trypsin-like peptidase domain-containing protein [Planctomycetes bacterium]|nr:trypsin-like peptidase domain-containing protein [Planctomycetota bacterium]
MNAQWPRDEHDARGTSWRAAVLVALAGLAVWKFTGNQGGSLLDPDAQPRRVSPRGDLEAGERATIELFERASPSVVFIRNVAVEIDSSTLIATETREGTGSGFVWDEQGHVVTNYHVIHASKELEVTFANHESYRARVVGHEVEKDLAVLQVDAPPELFKPLAVGTSNDLRVGQNVYAIGNPFGLDQTLTAGIISGLGREMPAKYEEYGRGQRLLTDLIQTQAPINPGNSGGPLLDSGGRLIGMNTAIVSPSGASAGIGFAIPVDTINRVITEILRYGQASRPSLGVLIAKDFLTAVYDVRGVVVTGVVKGSGAEAAGLRGETLPRNGRPTPRNDIIVGVEGTPISNSNDLFRALTHHEVGDKVKLDVVRNGQPLRVEVELKDLRQ